MPMVCMRRLRDHEEQLLGEIQRICLGQSSSIENTYQEVKYYATFVSTIKCYSPALSRIIELLMQVSRGRPVT